MFEEACGSEQVTVSGVLVAPEKLHAGSGLHRGSSFSVSQTDLSVSRFGVLSILWFPPCQPHMLNLAHIFGSTLCRCSGPCCCVAAAAVRSPISKAALQSESTTEK